jgi:hypothetical protein
MKKLRDVGSTIVEGEQQALPAIIENARNYNAQIAKLKDDLTKKELELAESQSQLNEVNEVLKNLSLVLKTATSMISDSLNENKSAEIGRDALYDMWDTGMKSAIEILDTKREMMNAKITDNKTWLVENKNTVEEYRKSLVDLDSIMNFDNTDQGYELRQSIDRNKAWADSVMQIDPGSGSNIWIWLIVALVIVFGVLAFLASRKRTKISDTTLIE